MKAMQRKTRKTEYKGVVFRSKTEAQFARYLELDCADRDHIERHGHQINSFGANGFEYEPIWLAVETWTPDFIVWHYVPFGCFRIIEYKPAKPTATYVAELAERYHKLHEKISSRPTFSKFAKCHFELYYGSIYVEERGWISFGTADSIHPPWEEEEDWLVNYESEVSETRFDLQH